MNPDEGTYRSGANAYVLDARRRLLLVQKSSYRENEWDLPGGGADEGEDPRDTIVRELREELGTDRFKVLEMSPIMYVYNWPEAIVERHYRATGTLCRGQCKYQFLVTYSGDPADIRVQAEEIRRCEWVTMEQLKERLVFPGQYENAVETLRSFKHAPVS